MNYLHIEYANPRDLADSITIRFQLKQHSVAQRWVRQVLLAQQKYTIDDPERFYGFGTVEEQTQDALDRINHCITLIKLQYPQISAGHLTDICDQDRLNYWHHVFETYHGLLEQEDRADPLTPVLADLNICVHRCESVARGAQPRHVVTYYGQPKTETLDDAEYMLFDDSWRAGTVFLNYAEIGKTIEDLAIDDDKYILPSAFQPFRHLSADFVVRFFEQTPDTASQKRAKILQYYKEHVDFFGPWKTCYTFGNIPLATIVNPSDIDLTKFRQYVKTVSFT